MPISSDDFKQALGRWATGVTVVTARDGDKIHGMTVSAFTEVSLDPPLVLVCADKGTNTLPFIDAGKAFGVNVLARDQGAISNKFASKKDEWKRFEGLEIESGPTGAPLIKSAVTSLDCRVVAAHEAGDHWIYVGQIELAVLRGGDPLVYCDGAYQALSSTS
jgi:flavin reductase (DIM6/NTAB) family NADH-FMN oxidoreductase RutF